MPNWPEIKNRWVGEVVWVAADVGIGKREIGASEVGQFVPYCRRNVRERSRFRGSRNRLRLQERRSRCVETLAARNNRKLAFFSLDCRTKGDEIIIDG